MDPRLSSQRWARIFIAIVFFAGGSFLVAKNDAVDGAKETPSDSTKVEVAEKATTEPTESYQGKIVVLPVDKHTVMIKASFKFMEKTIRRAELEKASAIILDMDTPGGRIDFTKKLVIDTLQSVTIPTYSFVNPEATSAGSIIALGTKNIYMRPASTIGSALAVNIDGSDIQGDMKSKVNQSQISFIRNVAELNGHNPDVAEAFVTREKSVRISGKTIHEKGEVLNLNAITATEKIDGKPVLAKGIVNSLEELVEVENLKGEIIKPEPKGLEAFAFWVQTVSVVLIGIGIAGAWLELKMPGFGLPGIVSVIAFGIFLFGNYMAGNLAGYGAALAIVFGLFLLALEIFVFPGTLVSGIVGMCFILGGVATAMIDKVDFDWYRKEGSDFSGLGDLVSGAITATSFAFVGALVLTIVLMRFLPDMKIASPLILDKAVPGGASLDGDFAGSDDGIPETSLVGQMGKATTDLRPAGKGRFGTRYLDIISDGEWIEKDEEVKVVVHEGSRVVVRKA